MNANIENFTNVVLTDLISTYSSAKEFLVKETPLVLQELLTYKFCSCLVTSTIYLIILITCIIMIKGIWDKNKHIADRDGVVLVICVMASLVCFPTLLVHTHKLIKIKFAPRVYLIDYAKTLTYRRSCN